MEQRRTEQAYWEDTYRFRDTARVVQVAEHPPPRGSAVGASYFAVVLDRTIFHPQGGTYFILIVILYSFFCFLKLIQ
jgi:hypothetical protein